MNYVVYKIDTGEILRHGICQETMFLLQAGEGEAVIEGVANDLTQYVCDGVVMDRVE